MFRVNLLLSYIFTIIVKFLATQCSPKLHLDGSPFIALQIFLSQGRPRGHDATVCTLWRLFFSESREVFTAEDLHPPEG